MLPTVATHLRRPRNRPAIASVSCRTRLVRQAAAPASQTLRRCSVNSGSGLNFRSSRMVATARRWSFANPRVLRSFPAPLVA